MAEGNELATGGIVGGAVALITAITSALGITSRLRDVEAKTKKNAAAIAELRDQVEDQLKDQAAELDALKKIKAMPADEVRALVVAEIERLRVAFRSEMKTMDERFTVLRERLSGVRQAVRDLTGRGRNTH